jgi:uncharacterized damage-inducible protein DinB
MDLLDRLLDHDRWATEQFLDVSRGLIDAQLDQPIDEVRDDRSLATLSDRYEHAYADFSALARQARDEQRLEHSFVDAYDAPMTFGGAVLHVVLHDAEHRAEILHILERLEEPDLPEVDHAPWDFVRRGFFTD